MTENSKTALKAFIAIAMAAVFCLSACRAGGGKESASLADETLSLVNTHYAAKAGTVEKQDMKKTVKRLHYLRVLKRVNQISAVVCRVSTALSLLVLTANLISVIKTIPER